MTIDRKSLKSTIESLRAKIPKLLDSRSMNEENTKNVLISPLISALGWDVHNHEEVDCEYKRGAKDMPVDYALKLRRTPCLFIEAKAIRVKVDDRKWANQILSYTTQSGVSWVVLTNGVDYRIYNANAAVPIEGKLFKSLSMTEMSVDQLVDAFLLLSRDDFFGKRIDRAWDAYHVDMQVQAIFGRLTSKSSVNDAFARLVAKVSNGRLTAANVKAALQRAIVSIDFPPVPDRGAERKARTKNEPSLGDPMLAKLIAAGLLKDGTSLQAKYHGEDLVATVRMGGTIEVAGEQFSSLSTAATAAQSPHFRSEKKGTVRPSTNGWAFWKVTDPRDGSLIAVDALRKQMKGVR